MITAGGLADVWLDTHEIVWRSATLEPILRGFWDWGNMAALPQEVQDKITATTRENARPYAQSGQFVFPHAILLGKAVKPLGRGPNKGVRRLKAAMTEEAI